MLVSWISGSPADVHFHLDPAACACFVSASCTAACTASTPPVCSTCNRIGRTNSSNSCTMALASCFVDDVGQHRLRLGRVGGLPPQQTGHHLNPPRAGFLLRARSPPPFPQPRQPIAKPLPFFQLLDGARSLKNIDAPITRPESSRTSKACTNHLARRPQSHLHAIRQQVQVEHAAQQTYDLGLLPQHLADRPSRYPRRRRNSKIRYASSLIAPACNRRSSAKHAVPHTGHDVPEEHVVTPTSLRAAGGLTGVRRL